MNFPATNNTVLLSAAVLVRRLEEASLTIVTAESCTGGLAASAISSIPGASAVFWGGFVCYSIAAKQNMLGISGRLIEEYGPVSGEAARAMAEGALEKSGAGAALAVTGIAGPSGGTEDMPAGSVWICAALRGGGRSLKLFHFEGRRRQVRLSAAQRALDMVLDCLTV